MSFVTSLTWRLFPQVPIWWRRPSTPWWKETVTRWETHGAAQQICVHVFLLLWLWILDTWIFVQRISKVERGTRNTLAGFVAGTPIAGSPPETLSQRIHLLCRCSQKERRVVRLRSHHQLHWEKEIVHRQVPTRLYSVRASIQTAQWLCWSARLPSAVFHSLQCVGYLAFIACLLSKPFSFLSSLQAVYPPHKQRLEFQITNHSLPAVVAVLRTDMCFFSSQLQHPASNLDFPHSSYDVKVPFLEFYFLCAGFTETALH